MVSRARAYTRASEKIPMVQASATDGDLIKCTATASLPSIAQPDSHQNISLSKLSHNVVTSGSRYISSIAQQTGNARVISGSH